MIGIIDEDGVSIGKPSMTNLPYDLGKRIIDQIMSTPKPDFSDTEAEVDRVKEQIRAQRRKWEDSCGNGRYGRSDRCV